MALTTLNLSGIKTGDSLNISVSQGGLTAGPYSVGSWGGGGDGGPISINIVARSGTEIAPESILFGVDLSSANFDTAGPTGSEVYDARMHDLQYFWTFDDAGTWSHLTNVLTAWKDRNAARAPFPTHLFRAHGDYDVSVLIVEPATGKTATASRTVTISNPDTQYAGTDTICVNNTGDSDFTGAPSGAAQINVNELLKLSDGTTTAEWLSREGGNAKRWLFKRGGDFEVSIRLDGDDTEGVTFGAYGSGNKPILRTPDTPASTELTMFTHSSHWAGSGDGVEIRFHDIDFRSTHDPTTIKMSVSDPNFVGTHWFFANNATQLIVADCRFDGFGGQTLNVQDSVSSTSDRRIHLDGCEVTNTGGFYPFIVTCENGDKSYFSLTGVSIKNPSDSYADQNTTAVRFNSARYLYSKGLEIFTTDSYGCFSVFKTTTMDGYIGFIEGYYGEGGDGQIDISTNVGPASVLRPRVHNLIIDGACLVGNWKTQRPVYLVGTGVTLRNALIYQPESTSFKTLPRCTIEIDHLRSGSWSGPLPDYVTDAPIRCYNNTWVVAADLDIVRSFVSASKDYSDFTNVTAENNVIEQANNAITNETSWSPLTDTVLFTPYAQGRRDVDTGVYETDYASSDVLDSKPTGASIALVANGGASTGLRAWCDITLAARLTGNDAGTIDGGAWQVS